MTLPNPNWVDSHGMNKFLAAFGNPVNEVPHTALDCTKIRNDYAAEYLSKVK